MKNVMQTGRLSCYNLSQAISRLNFAACSLLLNRPVDAAIIWGK
jgi:hypothetical protein